MTLTNLSEGAHTVYIKAKDLAGNEDPTPAAINFSVDTLPPSLDVHITPTIIWPPNNKLVDVNVAGSSVDNGSGLADVYVEVIDEYGEESVYSGFGTIPIEAWRNGNDLDGRHYMISVTAVDNVGNISTKEGTVLVPHDRR